MKKATLFISLSMLLKKYAEYFIILIFSFLISVIVEASPVKNIVPNSSFEEKNGEMASCWEPAEWIIRDKPTKVKLALSSEEVHTGDYSLQISCDAEFKPTVCSRSSFIAVDGEKQYDAFCWMKVNNINKGQLNYHMASITLTGFDKNKKQVAFFEIGRAMGTSDWAYYRKKLNFPREVRFVRFNLGLTSCTGMAYFDDVGLQLAENEFLLAADDKSNFTYKKEMDSYIVRHCAFYNLPQVNNNIVRNSSFEAFNNDWMGGELDLSTSVHGKMSMKLNPGQQAISTPIKVRKEREYIFSAYMKGEKAGAQIYSPSCSITFQLTQNWKRYSVPVKLKDKISEWETFYLHFLNDSSTSVWIDAVQLEENSLHSYSSPIIDFGIKTEKPNSIYHYSSDGNKINFEISVYNGTGDFLNAQLEYTIFDWMGQLINKGRLPVSVGIGDTLLKSISTTLYKKGYYKVVFKLISKSTIEKTHSIAIIEPLRNKDIDESCFFGTSGIVLSEPLVYSMAEEIGMKWIAPYCMTSWEICEPVSGNFRIPKQTEQYLSIIKQHNMVPIFELTNIPSWAGGRFPKNIDDEFIEMWRKYVENVVSHFKGKVKYWGMGWEWLMVGYVYGKQEELAKYIKLLKVTHETLKRIDPASKLIAPGCGFRPERFTESAKAFLEAGGGNYIDILNIHPYSEPNSPEAEGFVEGLLEVKSLLNKYCNDKELWITEVNYLGADVYYHDRPWDPKDSYAKTVSERRQAEYLLRMNILAMSCGIKHFLSFGMSRGGIHSINGYSFLNWDTSPKMAYAAYSTMTNLLRKAEYMEEIQSLKKIKCFKFKKDDHFLLTIWNSNENNKPISVKLSGPRVPCKIFDMMGNVIQKTDDASSIIFEITASPKFLFFETQKNFNGALTIIDTIPAKEFVDICPEIDIIGKAIVLKIMNHSSDIFAGKLDVNIPKVWESSSMSPLELCLKPRSQKTIVFPLNKMPVLPSERYKIEINLKGEKETLHCSYEYFSPLIQCQHLKSPITIDGSLSDWDENKFILFGENHVKSMILGSEEQRMPWGGAKDLTLSFNAQWDNKYLYLAFKINDDIFVQNYTNADIWKGDSLQVAFDVLSNASDKNSYDNDDYEYGFALTSNGVQVYRWCGNEKTNMDNIKCRIQKTKGQICYEIAIPYSALSPFVVSENSILGFSFVVLDNDNIATRQYLELTPGIIGRKAPRLFKKMIFSK